VASCRDRRSPRPSGSFRPGSRPKRRAPSTLWRADGRTASPRCGHERSYSLVGLHRQQCASCRYQVSATSGTVLHNSKTDLTMWFWAACLMTTDKRGLSALLLQRQLGLSRYETAWMILHKLRRAMVNWSREPLRGKVELDDTWVGGPPQAGLRGSRQQRAQGCARACRRREARSWLRTSPVRQGFFFGYTARERPFSAKGHARRTPRRRARFSDLHRGYTRTRILEERRSLFKDPIAPSLFSPPR
jgi:hypothetical protein